MADVAVPPPDQVVVAVDSPNSAAAAVDQPNPVATEPDPPKPAAMVDPPNPAAVEPDPPKPAAAADPPNPAAVEPDPLKPATAELDPLKPATAEPDPPKPAATVDPPNLEAAEPDPPKPATTMDPPNPAAEEPDPPKPAAAVDLPNPMAAEPNPPPKAESQEEATTSQSVKQVLEMDPGQQSSSPKPFSDEETQLFYNIRDSMDEKFRIADAIGMVGPWQEVSRRLEASKYHRSPQELEAKFGQYRPERPTKKRKHAVPANEEEEADQLARSQEVEAAKKKLLEEIDLDAFFSEGSWKQAVISLRLGRSEIEFE